VSDSWNVVSSNTMCACAKVNAKLNSVEEECECLRRALSVEVDGRRELEGSVIHFLWVYDIVFCCNLVLVMG